MPDGCGTVEIKFGQPTSYKLTDQATGEILEYDCSGWGNGETEHHLVPTLWWRVNEKEVGTNLVDGPCGAVDERWFPVSIG